MKTVSANLLNHLGGTVLNIAKCVKITLERHQPEIVDITKANPGSVTTKWDHGFKTGVVVRIVRVRGMTQVNDVEHAITVTGSRTFTIGNTSTYGTYLRGGEARRVFGFSTHQRSFTFENVAYEQAKTYTPSAARQAGDLSVGNLSIVGILDAVGITDSDVQRGLLDNARVEFFVLNYNGLGDGKMFLGPGRGNAGEISTGRHSYEAEFRGLEHLLAQNIGHLYSATCRAELGDEDHPVNACKVRLDPERWRATTSYTVRPARDAGLGSVVKPTAYNGRHFQCITAGTSGASEPAWNTTVGGTTNDGSVVWIAIEARTRPSTVAAVGNPRALFTAGTELSGLADQFFRFGLVTWITGQNRGMKIEVKTDVGTPKVIELFEQTPFDIRVGDQFEIRAGCDKLRDTCRDKFDNIYNFRGEPFVPGFDRIFLTPDAK